MPKEEIINLASRRSLFYPSAEIYPESMSGFWDFGPDGETIRRKIIDFWRNELVEKEGFLEIFGAQILPEKVFQASGHLESFNDPIAQCGKCSSFFRADKLLEEKTGASLPESMKTEEFDKLILKHKADCSKCGGTLGKVRLFNMMMKVDVGATGKQIGYLRPETCQTIFLSFDRIYKTMRQSLPLGIAQAGASFRNEIAPRNTLLRERELGQMEIEIFFNPRKINEMQNWEKVKDYKLNLFLLKDKKIHQISCEKAVKEKIVSGQLIAFYLARTQQLYEKLGIKNEKIRFRELEEEARAFYAKETWDFEIETDLGWIELIACNYRTDFDLKRHGEFSGKKLAVKEDSEEFIPHVFEISAGIDRTFYVLIDHAFRKEKRGPEERIFLDLNPRIAPYLAGVFPLMKKDGLLEKAREVFDLLNEYEFDAFFDEKGSIGKRYSRIDEIGVPFGITIDYDSMKDNTVTLRERNSLEQKRVKIEDLPNLLFKLKLGKIDFTRI
ncbi:MAG TPA: glycine--tRNA ligase [archaeon]|nr:glycine--tRNA ligase [archaeon]